jgi:hypothetical protein
MNTRLLAGALIALGAPILASAQCVAPVTPENALVGQNYVFSVAGTRIAAIGTFTGFANGYLAITETVVDTSGSNTNQVNRLAPASGRWMSNATCNGGMIQFMLNREFFSFDYTLNTTTKAITLTGRDESYRGALAPVQHYVLQVCAPTIGIVPGPPPTSACQGGISGQPTNPGQPIGWAQPNDVSRITGTATINPPKACPAGLGNPLNLLKGFSVVLGNSVGVFSFLNPAAYSGDITFSGFSPTYTAGRYIIYPDCSGGELLLMGNRTSATSLSNAFTQLEFVFTNTNFNVLLAVADGGQTP